MKPSLLELKEYAKGYQLVSVYKTIEIGDRLPVDVLRQLKNYNHKMFMLEHTSNDDIGNIVWDRYSYIGYAPPLEVSCIDQKITIATAQTSFSFKTDNPIDVLRNIIAQNTAPKIPGLPPFFGGFAGYFSYEYIHLSEPTCHFCTDNTEGFRDFDLMLFNKLYVFDWEEHLLYLICNIATDQLERNYREAVHTLDDMERLLSHVLEVDCPHCRGRGRVLSDETVAFQIAKEVRSLALENVKALEVYCHPAVAGFVIGPKGSNLQALEKHTGKKTFVHGDESLVRQDYKVLAID